MRAFIAIDFGKELKSKIADLQSVLRTHTLSGRWKYIDNFHLTLKFLDEVDSKAVGEISGKMRDICAKTEKFRLNISGIGNFPGKECFRVLWLGVDGQLDRLNNLQNEIDRSLQDIGFQKEKRGYTPHVTIAQDIVFDLEFDRIKEIAGISRLPDIPVEKAYLFKSEQIGSKRVYTPVNEFIFKGN